LATKNKQFGFAKTLRLSGRRAFSRVYDARTRHNVGPLTIMAAPNSLAHSRLGLSVSRRVGNAVMRNRIKRLLREAFRLSQHDLPQGYDWLVMVHRHDPRTLPDYQGMLRDAAHALDRRWRQRQARQTERTEPRPTDHEAS